MEQPRNVDAELFEAAQLKIIELQATLKKEKDAREFAESKLEVLRATKDLIMDLQDKMVEQYENTISKLQDENNALRKQLKVINNFPKYNANENGI